MTDSWEVFVLNEDPSDVTDQSSDKINSEETVKNIRVLITKLKGSHMSEDGSRVDYRQMSKSQDFVEYCKEVAKLKFLKNAESFNQNKKKSFFVNIYNSLTIHAMVHQAKISQGQIPESPIKIKGFWKIHAYNVGGLVYTLDEIEHGVLRANKGHPSAKKGEFSSDDPRSKVALTDLDPRVHFALNCGAKSCPPIRVYTEQKIDDQLKIATKSFLDQECNIKKLNDGTYEVSLSKLFLWYGEDFGATPEDVLAWILSHSSVLVKDDAVLSGAKIVYKDYNWESNSE